METKKTEKQYTILFLCDRTDPACCENEIFCSPKYCSHTLDLKYAIHRSDYEDDPKRFLKETCEIVTTENKLIFVEEENNG